MEGKWLIKNSFTIFFVDFLVVVVVDDEDDEDAGLS